MPDESTRNQQSAVDPFETVAEAAASPLPCIFDPAAQGFCHRADCAVHGVPGAGAIAQTPAAANQDDFGAGEKGSREPVAEQPAAEGEGGLSRGNSAEELAEGRVPPLSSEVAPGPGAIAVAVAKAQNLEALAATKAILLNRPGLPDGDAFFAFSGLVLRLAALEEELQSRRPTLARVQELEQRVAELEGKLEHHGIRGPAA